MADSVSQNSCVTVSASMITVYILYGHGDAVTDVMGLEGGINDQISCNERGG